MGRWLGLGYNYVVPSTYCAACLTGPSGDLHHAAHCRNGKQGGHTWHCTVEIVMAYLPSHEILGDQLPNIKAFGVSHSKSEMNRIGQECVCIAEPQVPRGLASEVS